MKIFIIDEIQLRLQIIEINSANKLKRAKVFYFLNKLYFQIRNPKISKNIDRFQMSFGTPSQTSSKLTLLGNYNSLISLQLDHQQLMNMPEPQKLQYFSKIKKQANYFLLNAFRALEEKNYNTAKDILVYIADSCSCIHPPDKESEQLIQLCCEELAQIKRVEDWASQRRLQRKSLLQGSGLKKLQLFVMKYNKFSGEFVCDESQRKTVNSQVLFYLSKLNAILFSEQTTQNVHSMIAMLKLYSIEMFFICLIVSLLILTEMTNMRSFIFGLPDNSVNYPALIIAFTFLVPLLVIYLKPPLTKNSQFFEIKLTQEIKKINQQCREKGIKIVFMMPEGMELNVKVEHDFGDQIKDNQKVSISKQDDPAMDGIKIDLSRIRKKFTNYISKNKGEGQIEKGK